MRFEEVLKEFATPVYNFCVRLIGNEEEAKDLSQEIFVKIWKNPNNVEKVVYISNGTVIREFRENIASTSLKVDDVIVVVGNPNVKGQIDAKLIGVMPDTLR